MEGRSADFAVDVRGRVEECANWTAYLVGLHEILVVLVSSILLGNLLLHFLFFLLLALRLLYLDRLGLGREGVAVQSEEWLRIGLNVLRYSEGELYFAQWLIGVDFMVPKLFLILAGHDPQAFG